MTGQASVTDLPSTTVLGLPVSLVDMGATIETVARLVEAGQPRWIVTADAAGMVQAQDDPALAEAYRTAALVTPDSQGVVWALRRKGYPGIGRVSGVDIVDQVCRLSSETGVRIFFLGAAPGVAEEAAERLRLRHPGCNIVGTRHGYFPADDDALVANEVAASRPDVLFVAMGIPRQETFIVRCLALTGAKVGVGVGGSFDVFSGRVKRAPGLVRALKLEWLWRLALNPSKIGKVRLLPRFVRLVLKEGR